MFIINCKNYEEISDKKIIKFLKTVQKVSKSLKKTIVVCPPAHLLSEATKFSVPIFAQHLDTSKIGSTTGFLIPELVKKSGVKGALINHNEHRLPERQIRDLITRLEKIKLQSVVCVKTVKEAEKFAKFNPNFIAIEPPELIGSGKAISRERPELITNAVKAVNKAKNSTKLLCGAGIVSGEDVSRAIELGAKGILVASGIVKAKNWDKIISEFATAILKAPKN